MTAVNGMPVQPPSWVKDVHFVGSVPLPSTSDVFRKLSSTLPGRLQRIPDGETGERNYFCAFQRNYFSAFPQVLRKYDDNFNPIATPPPTKAEIDEVVKALSQPGALETHYDDYALTSFAEFKKLQTSGEIPSNVRFQVCLPSVPTMMTLIAEGWQAAIDPIYEAALFRAVRKIEQNIPHASLTIQWDIPSEFAALEGARAEWPHFRPYYPNVRSTIITRVARLIDSIPPTIEAGLHMCYGDIGHRHFCSPHDMGHMVDIAREVIKTTTRDVTYIHMPVPKDRTDSEYFEPLRGLELGKTRLFLGLVHAGDLVGTMERMRVGEGVVGGGEGGFGVATECGLGRGSEEELEGVLEVMKAVTESESESEREVNGA